MRRFFARFLVLSFALPGMLAAQRTQPPAVVPAAPATVLAPVSRAPAASKPSLEGLDEFIVEQMKDWNVPGLAIAIVHGGKVILSKGYGFRDVERKLPVTPATLFGIGSITKSFAVVTLGMLADEGKLDWDKPVREYLPSFRLYDPVASERITVRDLVSHRSGLPGHDFFMYETGFSQKEMIERLRYLEPSQDLRTTYQYSNLLFMAAGYLAGQLAGTTWEELTRQKVLVPLGMERTNFSVRESQKTGDFALSYKKVNEEVKEIPHSFLNFPEEGAAGIINSSVEDMSRYLLFYLNEGSDGKSQILSRNNILQMQTSMIAMPRPRDPEFGRESHGMGLFLRTYRGHKLVSHGGGFDGFSAFFSFLPEEEIGVVVLTNSYNPLPNIVTFNAYDRLLGLEHVPWSQRLKERQQKQKESAAEAEKKGYTTRKTGTRPSHDLKDYVGEYEHPGYGIVRIDLEKDELRLSNKRSRYLPTVEISSPLKHFHYDLFEFALWPDEPSTKMKVGFGTNLQGEIDHLWIPLEENLKEIAFTRRPTKGMTEKSFLQPLAGDYELAGHTVTVTLKGDSLLVLENWGSRLESELLPTRGLSFTIKGLTGFTVEFKKDASGQVTEMVLFEPNSTFVAKKSNPQ